MVPQKQYYALRGKMIMVSSFVVFPLIAMTANAFDEDRMKAFEAGMDAHVAKPIDINILMHTLKGVLG